MKKPRDSKPSDFSHVKSKIRRTIASKNNPKSYVKKHSLITETKKQLLNFVKDHTQQRQNFSRQVTFDDRSDDSDIVPQRQRRFNNVMIQPNLLHLVTKNYHKDDSSCSRGQSVSSNDDSEQNTITLRGNFKSEFGRNNTLTSNR